jgi:hypothetical protein
MATNNDFFELKRVTSRPSPLASASMFSGTGSCEL